MTQPGAVAVPPEMQTKELRVATSVETDDLTPTSGHKIRVWGMFISLSVEVALTSTLRATLAFGTDHTTKPEKILASFRSVKGDDARSVWMGGINVVGNADEVLRLTNTTFSSGSAVTRATIYYTED